MSTFNLLLIFFISWYLKTGRNVMIDYVKYYFSVHKKRTPWYDRIASIIIWPIMIFTYEIWSEEQEL